MYSVLKCQTLSKNDDKFCLQTPLLTILICFSVSCVRGFSEDKTTVLLIWTKEETTGSGRKPREKLAPSTHFSVDF